MKYTTHRLSEEQKISLFNKYFELIKLIYYCNNMITRNQLKRLYCLITNEQPTNVDIYIHELITTGFLLQKKISASSKTQMLYLSKWPRCQFSEKEHSGDIPAINFTTQKMIEHIFLIDYIIDRVIPYMRKRNCEITIDTIFERLYQTSNLFLNGNQSDIYTFYQIVEYLFNTYFNIELKEDFQRDKAIAKYEQEQFYNMLSGHSPIPTPQIKIDRDNEKNMYATTLEQNKFFYSLSNMHKKRIYLDRVTDSKIYLVIFDTTTSLSSRKIIEQLSFITLMIHRYTGYAFAIHATVYVWDKDKKIALEKEENNQMFDYRTQEFTEENKKHHIMQEIGLKRQYWDDITTDYVVNDISKKYSVFL